MPTPDCAPLPPPLAVGILAGRLPADAVLPAALGRVAPALLTIADDHRVLALSGDSLREVTAHWATSPFPPGSVWAELIAGFGAASTGREAQALAERALRRARRLGPGSALVCLRGNADFVLGSATRPAPPPIANGSVEHARAVFGLAAARAGVSVAAVEQLHALSAASGHAPVTAREIADALEVLPRTALRTVQRLERAGLAERVGHQRQTGSGRPATLFRLTVAR